VSKPLLAAAIGAVVAAGLATLGYGVLGPQPEQQARRDGCGRSRLDEFSRLAPGWVYVNDGDYPATGPTPPTRWVVGVVDANGNSPLAAHPSGGDDPTTHDAFDFNINVLPDPAYAELLGGNPDQKNGNFAGEGEEAGRIHIEREETALPAFVWPEAGDRVAVMGSWVWDCGHWDPGGERTEIHPYRAVWTERTPSPRSPFGDSEGDLYVSTDATPAGQIAECAHKTKGDKQAYQRCTHAQPNWLDVSGDYELSLPAPPRPAGAKHLVVRVVNEGSTIAVKRPRVDAHGAQLRFHLDAIPGKRLVLAEQVFVGWRPATPASRSVHLRLTFTRLLTRRSMDPVCASCPNPESTLDQQIAKPPGEWLVFTDVDGLWRLWPRVYPALDGKAFSLALTQDLFVPRGQPFRLFVFTHECDFGTLSWTNKNNAMAPCPNSPEFGNFSGDDVPGLIVTRYPSPAAAIGVHLANSSNAPPSTCPAAPNPRGCYQITYRIVRVR
jgi:hypothetical protein